MELSEGNSRHVSEKPVGPVCATLIYAPFKKVPFGHVSVAFQFQDGGEVVVSPEACIHTSEEFSLLRGFGRNYRLRYGIYDKRDFLKRYEHQDRNVREYVFSLQATSVQFVYEQMIARAGELETAVEWYHTLANSCITNTVRHFDEARERPRVRLRYPRAVLFPRSITL